MTNTKKIATNTIVQIIGKVITTAISVIMLAYLARYLGVAGYGDYTTVFAFLGFFAIVADMGFYTVAVKEMARNPERSPDIMGNIFSIRIIFALFFLFLAPLVGHFIPVYNEGVKIGLWVGTLSSFFILLNQLTVGIFQVHLRMERLVISDVVSRIVLFVLTMVFIKLNMSLGLFIFANVVSNLCLFGFSLIMSRKFLKFSLKFDKTYIGRIIREALPLGIIIVLGLIYFKIDTVMLSIMKDSEAVGIYGAPYKVLEIFITVPSMFMGSVFPLISKYFHEKDIRLKDSFHKSFDFISMMALPILFGVFVLAKPITVLVLGSEFLNSTTVLQYLIFAVFIIFYGTIMGNFIIAADLQKKLLWIYLASVIVNITGNLILIPHYSYIGSSISTIFTESLVCLSAYLIVYNKLGFVPRFNTFAKALLSSMLMAIAVYFMRGFSIFITIPMGILIYSIVLFSVGGINKEMIKKVL